MFRVLKYIRGRRVALVGAVILAVATIASVTAAGQDRAAEKGVQVVADWGGCQPVNAPTRDCTGVFLIIDTRTEQGAPTGASENAFACLFTAATSFVDDVLVDSSFETGCVPVEAGRLKIAGLSRATLQSTSIRQTLFECTVDPEAGEECVDVGERDITISASWTAIARIARFTDRQTIHVADCLRMQSIQAQSRDGVATGTLAGAPLGRSAFASLSRGKFAMRSTC